MRVRVVNEDGVSGHTKILNAETGEELKNVSSVIIDPLTVSNEPLQITLELYPSSIDMMGRAEFYTRCPHCGRSIQGVAKE